jgi:hypothetical protein
MPNMSSSDLLASMPEGPSKAAVCRQLGQQTQAAAERSKRRNKYGATRTTVDGVTFDSKREAWFYGQMKLAMQSGIVRWFGRQPRFVLEAGVEYVADFVVVYADGAVTVVDVKSAATRKEKVYRIKKRQFESRYGIKITEAT